ncbi:hypothetical protein HNQ94_000137 [Salirhabdus euzebyi]|uniref:YhfM-like domain-containing protein n=1 Tax=Salirhabdus euzebyi TaxID=394506 RepID=A0A841PWK9_9BACI|nr:hypothetical protein [Salirhabdus euzebyi]MBB6451716.1 hypothetical protein [Salirhabdus euzebyi]
MNEKDDLKDIEQKIERYSKINMSDKDFKNIHQNLMNVANSYDEKERRGKFIGKIPFLFASVASVFIIGLLFFSMDGSTDTDDTGQAIKGNLSEDLTEQQKVLNTDGTISFNEVETSIKEQELELKGIELPEQNFFIQELNGISPEVYSLESNTLSIYVFPTAIEREKGMKAFEELTATVKLVPFKAYSVKNVIVFHSEGDVETDNKLSTAINELLEKKNDNKNELVKLDGKMVVGTNVSRVGENMNHIKEPHVSFTQQNSTELQTFVDAIQKAKKVDGVVDMLKADYVLTLIFEDKTNSTYSLWLGTDGGSIMDENNTHTVYILPAELVDDLNEYVR